MGSQSASDPVHTGNFYFDHEACAWNPRKDSAPTCYRFQWKYVALAVTFVVGLLCTGMPVSPRRRLTEINLEGTRFGKRFTATVDVTAMADALDAIKEWQGDKSGDDWNATYRTATDKPKPTMVLEPTQQECGISSYDAINIMHANASGVTSNGWDGLITLTSADRVYEAKYEFRGFSPSYASMYGGQFWGDV